jgi:O-antigen/teichoic acid export membrane protein
MNLSRKLVSNTLYLFLDWVSVLLFSFFFWIIIWKKLPPLDSGIFSTSQNLIIVIASFTVLGFSTACSKLIPEYLETKKYGMINSLIKFSSKTVVAASIIVALVFFLMTPVLTNLVPSLPSESIIFISLGVIFLALENLFGFVLIGFQDMKKYFLTDLAGNIIKFIIALLLILIGFQYVGPLAGLVIGFIFIFILRFDRRWFRKTDTNMNKKFVFYNYSFPALAATIGPMIFSNMPYIILAFFSGLVATGIFTTAISVTSQLTVLVSIMSSAIFPVVSQLSVYKNSKNKQNAIINLGVKYGLLLTLPLALVLIMAPRAIVLLLAQDKYLPAVNLFSILSVSFLIMGLSNIFLLSLYAVRKPKTNRNIWILASIVFLLLSIPLTFYYSAFGISVAFLISVSILFALSIFYLRKYMKFNLNWIEIFKMLVASFILVLFILLADILSLSVAFKYFFGVLGFVFYFVSLLFMKFFTKNDLRVLEILETKIPFLKGIFIILEKIISKYA